MLYLKMFSNSLGIKIGPPEPQQKNRWCYQLSLSARDCQALISGNFAENLKEMHQELLTTIDLGGWAV